jgi:hypothetical protein
MEADEISGQGSTGLFMNQLGLTDFLSLNNADSDTINIIQRGISSNGNQVWVGSQIANTSVFNEGTFRVAAKDAFVELLFLFKNNGTVYYSNPNYDGYLTEMDQMAPNLWSPMTGSTAVQNAARNNDLITRGTVALNFRNSTYHGYFKSLSWTMDADKPFSWNFNFVFKVERTITSVPIPSLS